MRHYLKDAGAERGVYTAISLVFERRLVAQAARLRCDVDGSFLLHGNRSHILRRYRTGPKSTPRE